MSLSLSLSNYPKATAVASVPGAALSVLPTPASVQYHAAYGVTTSSGRVTGIVDQKGLANATAGAAGSSLGGPRLVTEPYGLHRPLMRFDGDCYLNGATAAQFDQRAFWCIMVVRAPKFGGMTFFGGGSEDLGTSGAATTGGGLLSNVGQGSGSKVSAPWLKGSTLGASTSADADRTYIMTHGGIQVIAVASRTTANGGQRLYLNNRYCDIAQTVNGTTGIQGFEIGRYPNNPGTKTDSNRNSPSWLQGDVYEFIFGIGTITNANMAANVAAVVSNWAIPTLTSRIVLPGDSITSGSTSLPYASPAALMTEPGHPLAVPTTCAVINVAISGYTFADVITGISQAGAITASAPWSGKNILIPQLGRNDAGALRTGAQMYADAKTLCTTATYGLLANGWDVMWWQNIGTSTSANDNRMLDFNALVQDIATMRTETGMTSANLNTMNPRDIVNAGVNTFSFAQSTNSTYYNGIHLTEVGYGVEVYGGDTPQYGMAYAGNLRLAA